ncbi:hypothetical protein HNQ35_001414 [Cerasibacillus quisquiliarum]|uniref:DUF5348 domain-containing protein n=2 Tax=Bacillaceae TaxID=186817 RepID=A0A511UWG7_9BACI|nr:MULTISPECIES: DUF5348 domain-containing protein [Bacillaceae]MBB5146213.1 hypothetical protein [Cerasibacillus quisquiliarum]RST57371.1 hypothetical protein D5F11_022955 [Siminovitchia terrae]GEN30947.1 hypothetical protein CQU01_11850 [Cerasibacillus quisquiliarum]
MSNLGEIVKQYKKIGKEIETLLQDTDEMFDNTNAAILDIEEYQKYLLVYQSQLALEKAHNYMKELSKTTFIEGYLEKKSNGRYAIGGYELSSGSHLDIWVEDDDSQAGGYYLFTRIEHKEDYYAFDKPSLELEGRKARIRR